MTPTHYLSSRSPFWAAMLEMPMTYKHHHRTLGEMMALSLENGRVVGRLEKLGIVCTAGRPQRPQFDILLDAQTPLAKWVETHGLKPGFELGTRTSVAFTRTPSPLTAIQLPDELARRSHPGGARRSVPLHGSRHRLPADCRIDYSCVYHLEKDATDAGPSTPVVIDWSTRTTLSNLMARFGFRQEPYTYGELFGLVAYCEELYQAAGCHLPYDEQKAWRRASLKKVSRFGSEFTTALRLYTSAPIQELTAHHTRSRTLVRLGREYRLRG
ncbi:MAG: hypothetical protein OZ935_13345 [Pseudomonadota bacterium]|nr:hypothetical protein [Pseudomonadota bacterium]